MGTLLGVHPIVPWNLQNPTRIPPRISTSRVDGRESSESTKLAGCPLDIYGCFPKKIGVDLPKSWILIGFSMKKTIHFGGFPPILLKHPYHLTDQQRGRRGQQRNRKSLPPGLERAFQPRNWRRHWSRCGPKRAITPNNKQQERGSLRIQCRSRRLWFTPSAGTADGGLWLPDVLPTQWLVSVRSNTVHQPGRPQFTPKHHRKSERFFPQVWAPWQGVLSSSVGTFWEALDQFS